MKIQTAAVTVLGLVLSAGAASTLGASEPLGVYAVVQKVVFEPNDAKPERIQVWGAFSLVDQKSEYGPPQVGYAYFSCAAGQESTCRNEWNDLKSVSGSGTAVGFGSRRSALPRIRKADEKATAPDVYPLGMGVFKTTDGQEGRMPIIAKLKAALPSR